jgi:Flp pilus assembly CpaE family ATPase
VINRYNSSMKGFSCDEIKEKHGDARVNTVANDYQAVNDSVNKGRPLRQVSPGTPILRDVDALITDVFGLDRRQTKLNGRGIFGRMLDALTH